MSEQVGPDAEQEETPAAAPDTWIAASLALGRPVPIGEPYPHICRKRARGIYLSQRDCGACGA